jgi:hypothetical protein
MTKQKRAKSINTSTFMEINSQFISYRRILKFINHKKETSNQENL